MMRRIDLLPGVYAEQRRQRRNVTAIVLFALIVLGLLIFWWFRLGGQISEQEEILVDIEEQNQVLQAEINRLQVFAELDQEISLKEEALRTVMAGDIDWPALLTDMGLVVPNQVWLTEVRASAGLTEGAEAVETETAEVPINPQPGIGRIRIRGSSLTMPGVANWLLGLERIRAFNAVFLNDASETDDEVVDVIDFDSSVELNPRAFSGRFQGRLP